MIISDVDGHVHDPSHAMIMARSLSPSSMIEILHRWLGSIIVVDSDHSDAGTIMARLESESKPRPPPRATDIDAHDRASESMTMIDHHSLTPCQLPGKLEWRSVARSARHQHPSLWSRRPRPGRVICLTRVDLPARAEPESLGREI
jgi:hypothetical protein